MKVVASTRLTCGYQTSDKRPRPLLRRAHLICPENLLQIIKLKMKRMKLLSRNRVFGGRVRDENQRTLCERVQVSRPFAIRMEFKSVTLDEEYDGLGVYADVEDPRSNKTPVASTQQAIGDLSVNHLPFRLLCKHFVRGKSKAKLHWLEDVT